MAAADPGSIQRGRSYYFGGRARIERVEAHEASLRVRGSHPRPYAVSVRLLHGGPVMVQCDCPLGQDEPEIICKHKVAAVLTLHDYLSAHPPTTWEGVLSRALSETPRRGAAAASGPRLLLLFSLQRRYGGWNLYPCSLPVSAFEDEPPGDAESLARAVKKQKLGSQVKEVRGRVEGRRFVNATDDLVRAAQLAALTQQFGYYYGFDRAMIADSLFPLLAGALAFTGTELNPLQKPLRVIPDRAAASVALDETDAGLRVAPVVTRGDEAVPLPPGETQIVSEGPLWLLADQTLLPVDGPAEVLLPLLEGDPLVIPPDDRAAFLDQYLLSLAERLPVSGSAVAWEEFTADAPPVPRLYLGEEDGLLRARLRFGYGPHELPYEKSLPEVSTQRKPGEALTLVRIRREPVAEERAGRALPGPAHGLKRDTEPGHFALRTRTDPVDFLLRHVPRLAEAGFEIYGEEALKSARVNRNRPTLSFSVSSGIDWFDIEAVAHWGDTAVGLKDLRQAVRRRERFIKLADGSIGEIPPEWIQRYRHLFAFAEETEDGLRLSERHLTLLDEALAGAESAQTDAEFAERKQRLRDFNRIEPQPIPRGFAGTLRPYQKAGYDWLHFLHTYGFGGCLADDMGTGKTIQALAFLQSLRESGHAKTADLLVLPRSLLFNWQREAGRFTPGLRLLVHADQSRARDASAFKEHDLVLTTYGTLLRDIAWLKDCRFHYVILDESQAIKNPGAQSARAVRALQAEHRLVLTGTPVENNTVELWSQFAFLNPGLLGSLDYFREEFAGPIERKGDEEAAQLLRRLVRPFLLRRTKDQVASELPPRTERVLLTDMEPAQRALYNQKRDHYRALLLGLIDEGGINSARIKVLEGLLRLRQICNHPRLVEHDTRADSAKFELLLETLETLRAEGHKALVFSQFVQMLRLVRDALDARGIRYAYLDGSVKDRKTPVDAFQNDPALPFFLLSLKAGGVGLNLTAADYVLHIDPWWNPAVEMQATDRAHRIGQDKPVFVYKLITSDSVEEKIVQLQERKRALVEQIVTTESGFLKSLTRDDVAALFA